MYCARLLLIPPFSPVGAVCSLIGISDVACCTTFFLFLLFNKIGHPNKGGDRGPTFEELAAQLWFVRPADRQNSKGGEDEGSAKETQDDESGEKNAAVRSRNGCDDDVRREDAGQASSSTERAGLAESHAGGVIKSADPSPSVNTPTKKRKMEKNEEPISRLSMPLENHQRHREPHANGDFAEAVPASAEIEALNKRFAQPAILRPWKKRALLMPRSELQVLRSIDM